MGLLDRLFGMDQPRAPRRPPAPMTDEQAIQRYRYMLETAPPETIEHAHEEAFAKLTPEQRRQVLAGLAQAAPPHERPAIEATPLTDTRALARTATRAEIRQPGVMERTLSGAGTGGLGLGAASLLSSFALGFAGSMVANSFLDAMGGFGEEAGAGDGGDEGDATGGETGDNADWGDGGDFGGGDFDV